MGDGRGRESALTEDGGGARVVCPPSVRPPAKMIGRPAEKHKDSLSHFGGPSKVERKGREGVRTKRLML